MQTASFYHMLSVIYLLIISRTIVLVQIDFLFQQHSTEEAKYLVKKVHEIDPKAFVNIIKTDYINGRFYQKTDY